MSSTRSVALITTLVIMPRGGATVDYLDLSYAEGGATTVYGMKRCLPLRPSVCYKYFS